MRIRVAESGEVIEIDRENLCVVVQPGIINAHLKQALALENLFYAPDPASYEICSIGGNLAENSGVHPDFAAAEVDRRDRRNAVFHHFRRRRGERTAHPENSRSDVRRKCMVAPRDAAGHLQVDDAVAHPVAADRLGIRAQPGDELLGNVRAVCIRTKANFPKRDLRDAELGR